MATTQQIATIREIVELAEQRGRAEALRAVHETLRARWFTPPFEQLVVPEQVLIEEWAERVRTAATVAEVFKGDPMAKDAVASTLREIVEEAAERAYEAAAEPAYRRAAERFLTKQLTVRFGALDPSTVSRLAAARPSWLERWAERLLTAASLAEVFEGD